MERLQLDATKRDGSGKGDARKLRATGAVPAIVYGRGEVGQKLSVDARSLDRALLGGLNQLIDLTGAGAGKLVLVKELQRDPVSQDLIHCDFWEVDTTKTVHVAVPVRLEGRPHGVEMGGVLEPLAREVLVHCLPLAIPENLTLDVSGLDIGQALHASDFEVPDGVELDVEPGLTIVHVIAPRVEAEPEEEEAEAAIEGEEGAEPAAADAPAADAGDAKASGD